MTDFGVGSFGTDNSGSGSSGGLTNPFDVPGLKDAYFLQSAPASFGQYLTEQNPLSGFGRYLQTQYTRLGQQYQAHLADDPYQSFLDYLRGQTGSLQGEFNSLSPYQRGENPERFVGRTRYVGF